MNNICETYDKHMENENENENVIKDIIETLNDFSNSKFKHNAKGNIKHISARLKEGYSLDDFKDVIELKCFQWLNDSKMNSYLRPSTLFNGDKFPSYVEEARRLKNNPKLLKDEKGVKQNELDKIISGDWS